MKNKKPLIKKICAFLGIVLVLATCLANCFTVSAYTLADGNENKPKTYISMLNSYLVDGVSTTVANLSKDGAFTVTKAIDVQSSLIVNGWIGFYRGVTSSYYVTLTCDGETETLPFVKLLNSLIDKEIEKASQYVYMGEYSPKGYEKYSITIDLTKSKFYGTGKNCTILIQATLGTSVVKNIVRFTNVTLPLTAEHCDHKDGEIYDDFVSNNDGTHNIYNNCTLCGGRVLSSLNDTCDKWLSDGVCFGCGYVDPNYTPSAPSCDNHFIDYDVTFDTLNDGTHTVYYHCNVCDIVFDIAVGDCVYEDGICKRCKYVCTHSGDYTVRYVALTDNKHNKIYRCSACGIDWLEKQESCTYTDGKCICNTYCAHQDGTMYDEIISTNDGMHDYFNNCTLCGNRVASSRYNPCSYTNGVCDICGYVNPTYVPITPPNDTTETLEGDFTELFTGIYDGMLNVFYKMTNFELLGYNIANLILGIFTLVVVIIIAKKVI